MRCLVFAYYNCPKVDPPSPVLIVKASILSEGVYIRMKRHFLLSKICSQHASESELGRTGGEDRIGFDFTCLSLAFSLH